MNKAEPTLALKPRGDVTRNPKQGYQWPQNRTCECVRQKKKKKSSGRGKKKFGSWLVWCKFELIEPLIDCSKQLKFVHGLLKKWLLFCISKTLILKLIRSDSDTSVKYKLCFILSKYLRRKRMNQVSFMVKKRVFVWRKRTLPIRLSYFPSNNSLFHHFARNEK